VSQIQVFLKIVSKLKWNKESQNVLNANQIPI